MVAEALQLPYTRVEIQQMCKEVGSLAPILHLGQLRLTLHSIAVSDWPEHMAIPEHEHCFYEAFIVLDGEGQVQCQDVLQTAVPGSAIVFGRDVRHAWKTLDSTCRLVIIWFDVLPAIPLLPLPRWPILPDLLQEVALFFHDVQAGNTGWNYQVAARLTIMLSKILPISKRTSPGLAGVPDHPVWLVKTIEQYLLDHLAQKVTLPDIATHLSSSVRRITGDYRKLTEKSIMERLLEFRMIRAAALLQESEFSLATIGNQVGIRNQPSYFCRCFRKIYGVSPGNFRKYYATLFDLAPDTSSRASHPHM